MHFRSRNLSVAVCTNGISVGRVRWESDAAKPPLVAAGKGGERMR